MVDFSELVRPLLGLPVSHAWKGYGATLFVELGRLSPVFSKRDRRRLDDRGEACIWIEYDWRVEDGASVLYGGSNTAHEIDRGFQSLIGATVASLRREGDVPELIVRFSNGHCLRTMATVTGEPQWCVQLPSGAYIDHAGIKPPDSRPFELSPKEQAAYDLADAVAKRWGERPGERSLGRCRDCACFAWIDGWGALSDYGVCLSAASPADGRVVYVADGCSSFTARDETTQELP